MVEIELIVVKNIHVIILIVIALTCASLSYFFHWSRFTRTALALFAVLAASATSIVILLQSRPDISGGLAIIYAASLATLGWLVTLLDGRADRRQTYTLDFLQKINSDPVVENHKLNISKRYPFGKIVSPDDLDLLFEEVREPSAYENGGVPTLYSIMQILNLYELVATQVRNGHLEEKIIKNWQQNLILAGTKKFEPVIERFRNPSPNTRVGAFPEIAWLVERWTK